MKGSALNDALKDTLIQAIWFFDQNWTASFVILNARSKLSPSILETCVKNPNGDTDAVRFNNLRRRSAVLDREMQRDLFGASFALVVEVSQGLATDMDSRETDT